MQPKQIRSASKEEQQPQFAVYRNFLERFPKIIREESVENDYIFHVTCPECLQIEETRNKIRVVLTLMSSFLCSEEEIFKNNPENQREATQHAMEKWDLLKTLETKVSKSLIDKEGGDLLKAWGKFCNSLLNTNWNKRKNFLLKSNAELESLESKLKKQLANHLKCAGCTIFLGPFHWGSPHYTKVGVLCQGCILLLRRWGKEKFREMSHYHKEENDK